jgi:poly-gamma-glutamate synthesis protein (capsule biosynthesis protein)
VRVAGLLVATLALLTLHVTLVLTVHPRSPEAERAEPMVLERPAARDGEALLLFAGDTAEVDDALPILQKKGLLYPFGDTVDFIRDADLAVANLEAPITDGGERFPLPKGYVYRAPPASAAALAWAGFDVLGLANNHSLDYGAAGLADTVALAARSGMVTVGAGADPAEARRGVVATLGSLRVGLLAYCEEQLFWRIWVDQFARRAHPGVAALVEDDLRRDLERLRRRADVVVVMLHAGENYAPPRRSTVKWAERAIDLGADLVVVHHPHVAHPVEVYRGRPILLSLGNYAFGTPGHPALDYGWLAYAHVGGKRPGAKIDRVELVPLAVQNRRVFFRPEPLSDDELDRALARMRDQSRPLGAQLRIDRGRAILDL